jgi:hypothetical protein
MPTLRWIKTPGDLRGLIAAYFNDVWDKEDYYDVLCQMRSAIDGLLEVIQ